MDNEKLLYYSKNPDLFIQDFYGIKLSKYQKEMLNKIANDKTLYLTYPRHLDEYMQYQHLLLLNKIILGDKYENYSMP